MSGSPKGSKSIRPCFAKLTSKKANSLFTYSSLLSHTHIQHDIEGNSNIQQIVVIRIHPTRRTLRHSTLDTLVNLVFHPVPHHQLPCYFPTIHVCHLFSTDFSVTASFPLVYFLPSPVQYSMVNLILKSRITITPASEDMTQIDTV